MSNKTSNNDLEGLRQGPTKSTTQQLKANDMASVLMRLFPNFTLPSTRGYIRDDKGNYALTESGHKVQPDFVLKNKKILVEV